MDSTGSLGYHGSKLIYEVRLFRTLVLACTLILSLPLQVSSFANTIAHVLEHSLALETDHEHDEETHHRGASDHDQDEAPIHGAAEHSHSDGEPVHSHAKELTGFVAPVFFAPLLSEPHFEFNFQEVSLTFHVASLRGQATYLLPFRPPLFA